jgi:hypothetical protein
VENLVTVTQNKPDTICCMIKIFTKYLLRKKNINIYMNMFQKLIKNGGRNISFYIFTTNAPCFEPSDMVFENLLQEDKMRLL